MNIAIVIGVSEYSDAKDNLPGCRNDAECISEVLNRTDKFHEILYINKEENSATTKELITNFISSYKGKTINEFFFYYSGHGEFFSDEFYYILSDFDVKKRNQTSLQNTEIDNLIKTLSPILVVKVIDACQSGTTYIKEPGVLNKYFEETQKAYRKCYFLNSSLNDQSSYADENISFFTNAFIKAIKEHKSNEIRYKDIIDVIADEFSTNLDQTPLFVIQADLTEKFCSLNTSLKEYLNFTNEKPVTNLKETKQITLNELVKIDALNYTDKEGAFSALLLIKEEIETFVFKDNLDELYNIKTEFLDISESLVNQKPILTWFEKNENDFFLNPEYEEGEDQYGNYYYELSGFNLNMEVPFKTLSIEFENKFPNILSYHSHIVYFLSKKSIRFFYYTTNYIDENWDDKKLNKASIKWYTLEYSLTKKEELINGISKMLNDIQGFIKSDLEEKFKKDDDDLPF